MKAPLFRRWLRIAVLATALGSAALRADEAPAFSSTSVAFLPAAVMFMIRQRPASFV